jgi:hypothetical protein
MTYINRYKSLFESRGTRYEEIDGKIFRNYNGMIMPEGPASEDFHIEIQEQKISIKKLKGLLFRGTRGFKSSKGYYVVIADEFSSTDQIKDRNTRYEVKRALKLNRVKKISALELSESGYEVYYKALQSYRGFQGTCISEENFKQGILNSQLFEDIIHYWGVYHEDKLVGYSSNYLYDNVEVNYSQIKYNPDYFKKGISYALIHTMNEYYLKDQGYSYVSDGYMSLQHESNIQDFLIRNFGFYKKQVPLEITFSFPLNVIVFIGNPFKKWLYRIDKRFKGLFKLNELKDFPI